MAKSGKYGGPFTPRSGPFSGQSFRSYRQYLNAKAQLRGYESESQRHRIEYQQPKAARLTALAKLPSPTTPFEERYSNIIRHTFRYETMDDAFNSYQADRFRELVIEYESLDRSKGTEGERTEKRAWSYIFSGEERDDYEWGDTPGKE